MDIVKIGIVGLGNMGTAHANTIYANMISGAVLTAVCDIDEKKLNSFVQSHENVAAFCDYKQMLSSNLIDTVIIATPHYLHPEIAVFAFSCSINVLTEKPAGVYTKQVRQMNNAALQSKKAFCIMFNQRTNPLFIKAREMVQNGEIGEKKRLVWIITNWYRTQSYYNSGGWRGSFSGEGGGVLLNQAPHNLDIWQWIFGMPKAVTAHVYEGKYHNISVEDDADIFAEYESGATAHFITSTGEYPGTNRLEISGDRGKIVLENGKLTKYLLNEPERSFCFTASAGFYAPKVNVSEYLPTTEETAHKGILQNFVNHILHGEPLISPGDSGINELIISNAAYMSAWKNETVSLPLDEEEYFALLQKKCDAEKKQQKNANFEKNIGNSGYNERWNVRW